MATATATTIEAKDDPAKDPARVAPEAELKLIPVKIQATITRAKALVTHVAPTDGGLAITMTDIKTRKNLETVHTLGRDSDSTAVNEAALAVASRRPKIVRKAPEKKALNPRPAIEDKNLLALVEQRFRDPIAAAGLIIVDIKKKEGSKGPTITIADPEGRAEQPINLGTGGELDRLNERIKQVKSKAIAVTKTNGVPVPQALARLARRIGVQFDGAVEPVSDNLHRLVIQGIEKKNIRMNFEYNPNKLDKPSRAEFLKRIRQVKASSSPKVATAPKAVARPISTAIVIPQVYYDEATKLNVSLKPYTHRPGTDSTTVTPITLTVEIEGKTSEHVGAGRGKRFDFANTKDGKISEDAEQIGRFRKFCEAVIANAVKDLKAQLSPTLVGTPRFDLGDKALELPPKQARAEPTAQKIPEPGFSLLENGGILVKVTHAITDQASAEAFVALAQKIADEWQKTQAVLVTKAEELKKLNSKQRGSFAPPVEEHEQSAGQIHIPGVPWHYFAIARGMNVIISPDGKPNKDGSIPVTISDAPGFIAGAGILESRRDFRFLNGGLTNAPFVIAPVVEGERKSYRQNLKAFFRKAQTVVTDTQAKRQDTASAAVNAKQNYIQNAETIQHWPVPYRRDRSAVPKRTGALEAAT